MASVFVNRRAGEVASRVTCRWPAVAVAMLIAVASTSAPTAIARAADANVDFIAALRAAGWNDTAVAYIEWVDDSPLLTEAFRPALSYERAVSVAAQARQVRNRGERALLLARAAKDFDAYAQSDLGAPMALDALRQSANLYAEQAVELLEAALQSSGDEVAAHQSAARSAFAQAAKVAAQLVALCDEQLAALPKPAVIQSDPEAKARRDQLRSRQAEARFVLALISFEESRTYAAGSSEQKKALDDAWTRFGELVEEFRGTKLGASSRFYQGRCAQERGDWAKALGCYEDLIELPPPDADFRRLAARAHRRRAECLLAVDKIEEAVRGCENWLDASQPGERERPEWLEVAFRLATAYEAQLKSAAGRPGDARRLQGEVRNLLRAVAEHPNEFQRMARLRLASLAKGPAQSADYKNFADAFLAGRNALEVMNSSLLAARLARQNNPDAVEELESEAAASKDQALEALMQALDLADAETPLVDLNSARYFTSWLCWEDGRTADAAVLSEFVARRYADHEFAPAAAKLALAAWERIYQETDGQSPAPKGTSAYAARQLAQLAQLVAARWPESPEAASAVNVLINVALSENRLENAEQLLERLPRASRAQAELSLGAKLWEQYLTLTDGRESELDAGAQALADKAAALLGGGVEAYRQDGRPTPRGALASLYFVQLLLSRGDWQTALEILEDEQIGPLTLVLAEHAAASQPAFVLETYKAALRAYLAAQPPRRDDAQKMMESLEQWAERQPTGSAGEKLTRIYVGFGIQLQQQLKQLSAAGKDEQARHVAASFRDILDRLAARPDAGDWSLRSWIAETNLQIGQSLRGDEAARYLQSAQKAYEALLSEAERQGTGAPDADKSLAVRKRLGDCLAALGKFQNGIDHYAVILKEKPNMLDVQKAAALAYESWGAAEKRQTALDRAVRGSLPQRDGKNLVWGWIRVADAVDGARRSALEKGSGDAVAAANAARFEDLFFESHYHIAKARFIGATFAPAGSKRKYLEAAQRNIGALKKLYPKLGGPKWSGAFDALLNQINRELEK